MLLSCLAAAALAACGGGAEAPVDAAAATLSAIAASGATTGDVNATIAGIEALPTFHMAPAQLAEPGDVDVGGTSASARVEPHRFQVEAALAGLSTARLTPQALALQVAAARTRIAAAGSATPAATAITSAVYTPAQIRAAYGLPTLPVVGASLTAADAAALGSGQTIYLIDAYDDPNAYADLARFSTKFGLPACTNVALTSASKLPLASPPAGCTFSVAWTDSGAALKTAAPAFNSGWQVETALDVEWAHAIAPLARIVLIEAPDSMSNNLLGAVQLANKMGPGVVSMSFGAVEGNWVKGTDSSFASTGMSYVASSGDAGAQVLWPAVSPHVLAVGGTSLQWSGSGTRHEAAWSGSGGGTSAYEPLPSWQAGVRLPGTGAVAMRTGADVSFNADPSTGQYVAMTPPSSATTSWNAFGGTSIATPQWAGLVAVANAKRVAAARGLLGDFHATLYSTIAAVPGTYAAAFADVVDGNDGTCASCAAAIGFDQATGWGTPNAAGLLGALSGASVTSASTAASPVVPGGAYVAKTAVALSQSLGITAPAGVTTTYALKGAPTALKVSASGVLTWASPVTGSYAFTVAATTSAGKSATGSYTLTVTTVARAKPGKVVRSI
jgi:subtilase family serine protease